MQSVHLRLWIARFLFICFLSVFFCQYWRLNWEPCACQAGTLPLEPYPQTLIFIILKFKTNTPSSHWKAFKCIWNKLDLQSFFYVLFRGGTGVELRASLLLGQCCTTPPAQSFSIQLIIFTKISIQIKHFLWKSSSWIKCTRNTHWILKPVSKGKKDYLTSIFVLITHRKDHFLNI
jgi:hypothetical protein